MCNKRLRNYVYCMSRVLWTHLEHSHLISIYIVAHCTFLRDSLIIKNCSSLKCCLCVVRAVRFNYSAVPEDGVLRTFSLLEKIDKQILRDTNSKEEY